MQDVKGTEAAAERLTIPTIHLNGTSRNELHRQWSEAWDAIQIAYEAIKQSGPNGRDYYLDGPQALSAAVGDHMRRLQRIQDVMDEFQLLIEKTSV